MICDTLSRSQLSNLTRLRHQYVLNINKYRKLASLKRPRRDFRNRLKYFRRIFGKLSREYITKNGFFHQIYTMEILCSKTLTLSLQPYGTKYVGT